MAAPPAIPPSKPEPRAPVCAFAGRPASAKIAKGLQDWVLPRRGRGLVGRALLSRRRRLRRPRGRRTIADDALEADGVKVLDYWQAQEHRPALGQRQRLIAEGMLREGSLHRRQCRHRLPRRSARAESARLQGAKYVFDAWILPDLGAIQVEKLTTDRINRWRNKLTSSPSGSAPKRMAIEPAA